MRRTGAGRCGPRPAPGQRGAVVVGGTAPSRPHDVSKVPGATWAAWEHPGAVREALRRDRGAATVNQRIYEGERASKIAPVASAVAGSLSSLQAIQVQVVISGGKFPRKCKAPPVPIVNLDKG